MSTTDANTLSLNTDRQLKGGNAEVVKLHQKDYEALLAASGGGGTPINTAVKEDFYVEVLDGNVDFYGVFTYAMFDTKTVTGSVGGNPKFLWDVDIANRFDITPPGLKMYISSSSILDVGQIINVEGVSLIDDGDGVRLKQVFGVAVLNGQNQVEVKEVGTGLDILFFRLNGCQNISNSLIDGTVYIASTSTLTAGVPDDDNSVQSIISLIESFGAVNTSTEASYVGSFTIPHRLSNGKNVKLATVNDNALLPDDSFKLFARFLIFNQDGTINFIRNIVSGQSGGKTPAFFNFNNSFLLSPGSEVQYRLEMTSVNQTFSYLIFGLLKTD